MKKNFDNMLCLDVFLSQQKTSVLKSLSITHDHNPVLPLVSWDVFSSYYFDTLDQSRKKMDLKKIKNYAKKHQWKNDIESMFHSVDFSAIVLTDKEQHILWVNEGFTSMTGYHKKEVLHKTPGFLQGPKTSSKTKSEISYGLNKGKPFETALVNYRKNKTTYNCKVHIFPLYNTQITHFIALEKEVL